jgi:microcystin-dependent protein
MTEPYLGEIRMFGGNFAPRGWVMCDGQLVSIAENDALYNLLGTTYGGDGSTRSACPTCAAGFRPTRAPRTARPTSWASWPDPRASP